MSIQKFEVDKVFFTKAEITQAITDLERTIATRKRLILENAPFKERNISQIPLEQARIEELIQIVTGG